MEGVEDFKSHLDALLERMGKKHRDIWEAIPMTESGYYRMLKRGSIDLRTLLSIARALNMPVDKLLSERSVKVEQVIALDPPAEWKAGHKPQYIEDRIARLETELRKLKTQIKNL